MSSVKRPRGSIHKIREFELEKIHLVDEFDILQIVGEGWFGKILLVEHRASQTEMVLKAVPKPYVSLRDFYREFHYGLHLGIHRNIVTTYDVAFETAGFYVFTQEYAPLGDLTSNVTDTGIGELHSKRVAKQIASALDYIHSKDIVHRDVKLDNVLIYRSDFSRVKLCDFGESYQSATVVERRNEWLPYSPPEVLQIKPEGTYKADPCHDIWQFGIVIFVCLTGCLPWQKAASDDPRYVRYLAWQGTMMLPIRRIPKLFKLLSSRAARMFRRFLEPRSERRPKTLSDLIKFMDDRWLAKSAEKDMAEYEPDELCPSMYSFHSSPDEKNRLLYTLVECGIETSVDRQTKKNRIKDWIESSIITEEDEGDDDAESVSASPSSSVSREPVAGHISSIRTNTNETQNQIKSTLKDASQKHFDPRTGALQLGPSEMGNNFRSNDNSPSPVINKRKFENGDNFHSSMITLDSRNHVSSSDIQLYNMETNRNLIESKSISNINEKINHNPIPIERSFSENNSNLTTDSESKSSTDQYNHGKIFKVNIQNNQQTDKIKNNSPYAKMYASSSAIDNYASTSSNIVFVDYNKESKRMNSQINPNKSVTFVGLANAFQSLAQISLPSESIISSVNNSIPGQKKDSGYGSYDKIRTTYEETETSIQNQQSSREKTPNRQTKGISPTSIIKSTSTMKDSPYDQIQVRKMKK